LACPAPEAHAPVTNRRGQGCSKRFRAARPFAVCSRLWWRPPLRRSTGRTAARYQTCALEELAGSLYGLSVDPSCNSSGRFERWMIPRAGRPERFLMVAARWPLRKTEHLSEPRLEGSDHGCGPPKTMKTLNCSPARQQGDRDGPVAWNQLSGRRLQRSVLLALTLSRAGLASRIQQFVQALFRDSAFFPGDFPHCAAGAVGLLGDGGGLLIPDHRG
jgi:hypothetical protein